MAIIIHTKDIMANTNYEPPCNIVFGITHDTVPDSQLIMGRTTSGPDMRNQRHYHVNCNVGQYRISGHDRMFFGPEYATVEMDVAPGDFSFIPNGEIHGAIGQGEPCDLIFCYIGISSLEEAGTTFIEPPHENNSNKNAGHRETASDDKATTRARIIRSPKEDRQYAQPLITGIGINQDTVENPGMFMGSSIMPPGSRNRRHYHANTDVAMYKIKGHDMLLIGPDHDIQEMEFKEGDFLYIPKGEIHGAYNVDNKEGFLVFCYPGISSGEEGVKIYVEPPVV